MTPPRKKSSGASRGKGKKSATTRRKSSRAKPKPEAQEKSPDQATAEGTGAANPEASSTTTAAVDPIALEPGVSLPAPKPPGNAREARDMAAAEQQGEADGAPESDPDASAEPAPEAEQPPAVVPITTGLRDASEEVSLEDEPKDGYDRGRVILGEHLYYVERKGGGRRQYVAKRDQVLELPKDEIDRGLRIGALVDASEPPPPPLADPLDLDDAKLAEWVESHTIDEVIPWATSVERANRLLEAERKSPGDPRVGVLRGIEAVLSSEAV